MLKDGSNFKAIPSNVARALALFRKYGGMENSKLATSFVNDSGSFSKRILGTSVALPFSFRGQMRTLSRTSFKAITNFSLSLGSSNRLFGRSSRSTHKSATASILRANTSCTTAHTIPSRTDWGTELTRPKSKYPNSHSPFPVRTLSRLPVCGSACNRPVSRSCDMVHSMAFSTSARFSFTVISLSSQLSQISVNFVPSIHSITRTLSEHNSGITSGTTTWTFTGDVPPLLCE
mmetsp:Transcript_4370/g.6425  ORF Transcript_4370/g.6425 Transcript_4370/m.6425 type:complete len:233 (+) Transcript_4370:265-963(+)